MNVLLPTIHINPEQSLADLTKKVGSGNGKPPIIETADNYQHRLRLGDIPVAFVDALTGDEKEKVVLPASSTIGEHLEAAQYKVAEFMAGRSRTEINEKIYYIGVCLVGGSVQLDDGSTDSFARLAIFEESPFRHN